MAYEKFKKMNGEQLTPPNRILIPFNISAKKALEAVKLHLRIGEKQQNN